MKNETLIFRNALEHIKKACQQSRSQTRRIRWIEQRADIALNGKEYNDKMVDLPRKSTPETMERLQKKYAYAMWKIHTMTNALELISDTDGDASYIALNALDETADSEDTEE